MGLRERAVLLKGQVVIDSAPGRGTCVKVHIPVPDGDDATRVALDGLLEEVEDPGDDAAGRGPLG